MVGFKSHGMVMAATSPDGSVVRLLQAPDGAAPGERIVFQGHEGDPFTPQQMSKKKVLEAFIPVCFIITIRLRFLLWDV